MSNYTKTTNFAAKDSLPSGNAAKIVKGTEIDTEFNNIATASATKANIAGPTFTGTVTIPTVDLNGGAIDGTTVGASTAAAITGTTIVANTSINIAGDGATVTGIKDEDDMSSNSATKLATQQSIKAYVDSQVTAQDLDVTDGSTSIDIDLDSESLGILGGTGIDSTASGTGVTLAIDATVATLAGTQTLSNKTLSTPVVSGNLTTDGLIDGRDVATDGAKLDGIEAGATADQTAAEIKTAYESNADTNAFTDADHSKLDGIEASADVTDTANVTAAGALMDSELTSEASVKALNQGVATTDSPTFAGVTAPVTGNVTGNLTGNVTGNVTGNLTGDVTGDVTGDLTGSVLTAAQTNITSVGTLTDLDVSGDLEVFLVDGLSYPVFNVDVSTKRVGILNASPDVSLDIGSATDAMHVPVGTTAQRPGSPAAGYFRYNSTTGGFEGYTDAWGAIAGGGGGVAPSIDTMTGDGSDTTLALTNAPVNENATFVTIDGVTQHKSTYSVSGTTLTFSTAPPTGSAVEAITLNTTTINTASILQDADGDTKVQVEESSDEDKIRFDTAGTERAVIDSSGLDVTGTVTADGLTVDTNTLVVDATNNRVGIGTSTVNRALEIAGNNNGGAKANYIRITDTDTSATANNQQGGIEFFTNDVTAGISASMEVLYAGSGGGGEITFNTNASSSGTLTEALRIDSSQNVGIGTSSPTYALSVNSGSSTVPASLESTGTDSWLMLKDTNTTLGNVRLGSSSNSLIAFAGGSEAMRIDGSRNLLVGKTSTATLASDTNAGHTLYSIGIARHVASGSPSLQLTRTSSDGDIAVFTKDGTTVGSIGVAATNNYFAVGNSNTSIQFYASGIAPATGSPSALTDNTKDIGSATVRWDDIYATNGTIQTSDRNEKQDIAELSDAEQRVAVAAKGLLRKFRWISSVEENGDDARVHFGIIAQDLQDAFTAEGLDAGRYAMFISSTWTDEDTGEERTRLGVRYSELLAFIISAI